MAQLHDIINHYSLGCITKRTIYALVLNGQMMLAIREEEALLGRHPPP
jgi:hypothetical protein